MNKTGLRKGSSTLFYPLWHKDVESYLVLKNNKGSEDNRVRHMDYGVQLNGFLLSKMLKDEEINLFSPHDVPDLHKAFFDDQDEFVKLYNEYSNSQLTKATIKGSALLNLLIQERSSTGRIYIQFVDNTNNQSPFNVKKAPIRQSNLCMEVLLPTLPLSEEDKTKGEIALCTLAAFNFGIIDNLDELEYLSELIVRALDALLDYQSYPVEAARKNLKRRTLGIGGINYAYWLAKNGFKYSDNSGLQETHDLFESIQFFLLKASNKLAKEQSRCEWFNDTKYSEGQLPIDWYNKSVDSLVKPEYKRDWESLRKDIAKYGLRNSTLTALMPAETSALISNATNGIEPIRGLTTVKSNKSGIYKVVAPEVQKLFLNYETCWEMENNIGYLNKVAVMQKFVDQGISANEYHDPSKFENNLVPRKNIVMNLVTAYKNGLKTLYYYNTRDSAGEDSNCDSCKI